MRRILIAAMGLCLLLPDALAAKPAGRKADGTSYRILIVNDKKLLAREIGRALVQEGFDVVGYADDGPEGVSRYRDLKPRPDLVLLAVRMEPMDGVTTMGRLRRIDGKVKTLVTCVAADEALAKNAFLLGASDYLILPAERSLILEKIAAILER